MNAIGFDFTTLAVLWLTASLVMIPLLVLAVRFAVVPLLDTIGRLRTATPASDRVLEQRLARAEAHLARISRELERLSEATAARAS